MKKKSDNNFMNHFNLNLSDRYAQIRKKLYENLEDWRMNYGNSTFTGSVINNFEKDIHEPIDRTIKETLTYIRDYCLQYDEDPRNWFEVERTGLTHMIKNYFMAAHDVYITLYNRNKSERKKINTSSININSELFLLDAKINSYVIKLFAHSDKCINDKKKLDAILEEDAKEKAKEDAIEKANAKQRRLKTISIVVGIIVGIITIMGVVYGMYKDNNKSEFTIEQKLSPEMMEELKRNGSKIKIEKGITIEE